jgi:hypothetical protein
MTTSVLSMLIGKSIKDPSHVIKQGWQGTRPFMTGCLIITDDVFSICSGLVVDVGQDEKSSLYSVTVEYEYAVWVRYCQLESCDVAFGDTIERKTRIGTAYNGLLRFEYCSDEFSVFPVRTTDRQMYKHDPMPILVGDLTLPDPEEATED